MSAAAFAKGLLDLEGQLTPILVCPFLSQRTRGALQCHMVIDFFSSFSRFLWLAKTLPCWMVLIMPALKWKRLRFVPLFMTHFLFCINHIFATRLNYLLVVTRSKLFLKDLTIYLEGIIRVLSNTPSQIFFVIV